MLRLGIVSDSHDTPVWLEPFLALANRERYDAVFHLGDGRGDVRWLAKRLNMPLISVAGNCDYGSSGPREALETFEGHRILAVHGHKYDVRWGLERLSYRAEELCADIALYGHTHEAQASFVGPVLTLNPGALLHGEYAELLLDGRRVTPYLKNLREAQQ